MGENVKKQKKSGSINAFVIVFLVIVGCYIMSLFISPGAFDREVLNGRTVVIANSFHTTEKTYLGPQAIFPLSSLFNFSMSHLIVWIEPGKKTKGIKINDTSLCH